MSYLTFLAGSVLLLCLLDRAWLRYVVQATQDPQETQDAPLFDPEAYLELIARMTELCHGDRAQVDHLIERQQLLLPHVAYVVAVRMAMQQLTQPDRVSD